ncbi:MAG: hypothetical protein JSS66_14905 [Armatimonadetes bacterium]|nr:hypothetical protein [Armatimonadota bacterium]
MEPRPKEINLPTKRETGRLVVGASVLAILGIAVAYASRPYEFDKGSPILIKGDVHNAIDAVRREKGHWPVDEHDPQLVFSDRVKAEQDPPTFKLLSVVPDRGDEIATYTIQVRGLTADHRIKFDPKAKSKRH